MSNLLRGSVAVLLVAVCGCFRSPSPHFFSLVSQKETAEALALHANGIDLEVGSIVFPQYLEDPRIAVRSGEHEVVRDEYDRWVEDLNLNFRRALLGDLSRHLKSSNVFSSDVYSQRQGSRVLQIEVLQFDVTQGGDALLKIRWAIAASRAALATAPLTVSEFTAHARDNSSEARVSAMSGLVDSFAAAVSQSVSSRG